jgi:hypothetical protein
MCADLVEDIHGSQYEPQYQESIEGSQDLYEQKRSQAEGQGDQQQYSKSSPQ